MLIALAPTEVSEMKRRDFLVLIGFLSIADLLTAEAQQVRPSRIGFLRVGPPPPTYIGGFKEGLHEQGLIEGRDFVIEYALAQSAAQIPETAVQLALCADPQSTTKSTIKSCPRRSVFAYPPAAGSCIPRGSENSAKLAPL
jgi:hypothetical protein